MALDELSCAWEIDTETCGLGEVDLSSDLLTKSIATASSIMARLSGYTVGLCEAEIRPLNLCRECRSWCCGGTDGLYLTGPSRLNVWDVTRVRLGATEYPLNTWHFDRDSKMLWRVPPDVWPTHDEKWSKPGTGEAFVVDVSVGSPPDAWALDVVTCLVRELYLSCVGKTCRLPSNTTTVTSQGITVKLRDDEVNMLIPELAAWVHAVNPYGARLPAAVFSPEVSRGPLSVSNRAGGCCGAYHPV